jgi:hypothetical protein
VFIGGSEGFFVFGVKLKGIQYFGFAIEDLFYWQIAVSLLLFFAVACSTVSLKSDNSKLNWGQSMISFIVVAFISGFCAYFFSSIHIYDAGSYFWLYKVVTFGFMVFLSIVGLIKKVVEFAQVEDKKMDDEK